MKLIQFLFRVAGSITLIVSSVVLAGWFFSIPQLIQIVPAFFAMNPLTAVLFFFSGLVLISFSFSEVTPLQMRGIQVLVLFIAFLAAVRLINAWLGSQISIDQLFFHTKISSLLGRSSRMAIATAVNFLLLGIGGYFRTLHNKKASICSLFLLVVGLMISLLALSFYVLRSITILNSPLFFSMAFHTVLLFLLLFTIMFFFRPVFIPASLNKLRYSIKFFVLGASFMGLVPFWYILAVPRLSEIPQNFRYTANVYSVDNFYDQKNDRYAGEAISKTKFSYETIGKEGSTLLIKNNFDVKTFNDEPIFSVERVYGIDPKTGEHVIGAGDRDRTGYLFAPRNLKKNQSFTYWHVNYDQPAEMQFIREKTVYGLPVFEYQAKYRADQTQNLLNLPDVGKTKGIELDIELTMLVEPKTGNMISYQDRTTAWYYDLASKKRIHPWNTFSNTVTSSTVKRQVLETQQLIWNQTLTRIVVPTLFFVLALFCFILGWLFDHPNSRIFKYLPIIFLIFGVCTTIFIFYFVRAAKANLVDLKFENDAESLQTLITKRLGIYAYVLQSTAGFMSSSENVTRNEWKQFVEKLEIQTQYPGILGVGYAEVIESNQLTNFENKIKAEGFPEFEVTPVGNRELYTSIKYLEPFTPENQRAFGFDMFQESIRHKAMSLSALLNKPIISGKVTLVQEEIENQPGFLMYVPVFKDVQIDTRSASASALATTSTSTSAATSKLIGYVYSPFRMSEFMGGALQNDEYAIDIEIFDGPQDETNSIDSDAQLFNYDGAKNMKDHSEDSRLEKQFTADLFGHYWTFRFLADKNYGLSAFETNRHRIVLFVGSVFTLIMSILIRNLTYTKSEAMRIAQDMTVDINTKNNLLEEANKDLVTFKLAVENSGDHVIITDAEGNILYANSAFEKITGFTRAEVLGKKAGSKELWGGLMDTTFYKKLWQTIKIEKKQFLGEVTNHRKNGQIYYALASISPIINSDGNVDYFVAIERDITILKEQTKNLEAAEARDAAMLNSIGDSLIAVDKDTIVILVNKSFEEQLGWKAHEIVGKKFASVVKLINRDGELVSEVDRPIARALQTKETINSSALNSFEYIRKDGTLFAVTLSVSPIILNNEVIGAVEVFRDVSKEKEIDKAKTEFVSLASHQLRTPLTAINWYSELLSSEDDGKLTEEQKTYVNEISIGSKRMSELVSSLLNVSRIELGTFEVDPVPTDLLQLVYSVIDELKLLIAQKHTQVHVVDKKMDPLSLDPKLFRMVCLNLLTNAIKYTPDGGSVTIDFEGQSNAYTIKISDTGCGIPKNQQDKIFNKLFRADNVREKDTNGTGLGLYIVKSIIDQSGGKIWFESIENSGTTFFIELPESGMKKKEGTKPLE